MRAMANSLIHSTTYSELIEKNRRQDKKTKRAKGNYGTAPVMNLDVIVERRERQREVLWDTALLTTRRSVMTSLSTNLSNNVQESYL